MRRRILQQSQLGRYFALVLVSGLMLGVTASCSSEAKLEGEERGKCLQYRVDNSSGFPSYRDDPKFWVAEADGRKARREIVWFNAFIDSAIAASSLQTASNGKLADIAFETHLGYETLNDAFKKGASPSSLEKTWNEYRNLATQLLDKCESLTD